MRGLRPVFKFSTVALLRHFATALGLIPSPWLSVGAKLAITVLPL
jgi:hypothetical protein